MLLFLVIHVHVYITLVFKDLIGFVSKIKSQLSILLKVKNERKRHISLLWHMHI